MKISKKLLALFVVIIITIVILVVRKNYKIFEEYHFDSGEYKLYGFVTQIALHGETPFAINKKNFVITDIVTLNQMKQSWKLKPWRKRQCKCGSTYILVLMKGSKYIKHFSVNFDCEYLTKEDWYHFSPKLLTKYQKNMISISDIEVQALKDSLYLQTGMQFSNL